MDTNEAFDVPSEFELIEWFGCEPVKDGDGRYHYKVSDKFSVTLIFSFDVIESSIQTSVIVADAPVTKVVQESARQVAQGGVEGDSGPSFRITEGGRMGAALASAALELFSRLQEQQAGADVGAGLLEGASVNVLGGPTAKVVGCAQGLADRVIVVRQHAGEQLAAGLEPVGDGVGDVLEVLALVEGRVHDHAVEMAAQADGGSGGGEGEEVGTVDEEVFAFGRDGFQVGNVFGVEFDHGNAGGRVKRPPPDPEIVDVSTSGDVGCQLSLSHVGPILGIPEVALPCLPSPHRWRRH
jgi:hypothetical protein